MGRGADSGGRGDWGLVQGRRSEPVRPVSPSVPPTYLRVSALVNLGTGGIFVYPGLREGFTFIEHTLTRRGAMTAIVKACVVGVLGLTVLLGSSAVSGALPVQHFNKIYCQC